MTAPKTFDELVIRARASDQMEAILRAIFLHREEEDLTYAKIGEYCAPKLTAHQVSDSVYDYRTNFQDMEGKVRARILIAGRLGKKGLKTIR